MRESPGDHILTCQGLLLTTDKRSGANLNTNSSTYVTGKEKSHVQMIKVGALRIGEINELPNKKICDLGEVEIDQTGGCRDIIRLPFGN